MKYIICSDIHGSIESAEFIVNKFKELKCDKIICLGDVLYHGPRNDIPDNYNPKKVVTLLNQYAKDIHCVLGNCDAEVDQMVLDFKLQKSFNAVVNDVNCHFVHGHHLETLATFADVIFYGHTHVYDMRNEDGRFLFNPGSITLPKNGNPRTYMIWDNHEIILYDIDGNIINQYKY